MLALPVGGAAELSAGHGDGRLRATGERTQRQTLRWRGVCRGVKGPDKHTEPEGGHTQTGNPYV